MSSSAEIPFHNDALNRIDVRILDHIIVGGGDTTSLAERGLP
jgi:DNA repair protein RadC